MKPLSRRPLRAWLLPLVMALGLAARPALAEPEHYVIDTAKMHAFIEFRIPHLGFSLLLGRFDDFSGEFTYDPEDPDLNKAEVIIRTASVDTNHAERDKHLRSDEFLNVQAHPTAHFIGREWIPTGEGKAELKGELSLNGVTRPVTLEVTELGHGPDPWGGYRRGFTATTGLRLADYDIDYDLGPMAKEVQLFISLEGVRQ